MFLFNERPTIRALLAGTMMGIGGSLVVLAVWVQPLRQSTFFIAGITPEVFKSSWGLAILFAVLAAVANGLFEELLWRIAIVQWLLRQNTSWLVAVIASAVAFGSAHYFSVPSGSVGILLTVVFGFVASILIRRSRDGVWCAIVAHVVIDAAIILALN